MSITTRLRVAAVVNHAAGSHCEITGEVQIDGSIRLMQDEDRLVMTRSQAVELAWDILKLTGEKP